MTRSSIWIGIGAFVLATMGAVSTDTSNGDISLSSLSLGGTPALAQAQERRKGPGIPDILETLDDLDILEGDDDDGPDDDGPDDDGPDDDDDGPGK